MLVWIPLIGYSVDATGVIAGLNARLTGARYSTMHVRLSGVAFGLLLLMILAFR